MMKTFEHFNTAGAPCPVCKTHDNKHTILVAKDGTEKGGIMEAIQVHLDCIDLRYHHGTGKSVLYQVIEAAEAVDELFEDGGPLRRDGRTTDV